MPSYYSRLFPLLAVLVLVLGGLAMAVPTDPSQPPSSTTPAPPATINVGLGDHLMQPTLFLKVNVRGAILAATLHRYLVAQRAASKANATVPALSSAETQALSATLNVTRANIFDDLTQFLNLWITALANPAPHQGYIELLFIFNRLFEAAHAGLVEALRIPIDQARYEHPSIKESNSLLNEEWLEQIHRRLRTYFFTLVLSTTTSTTMFPGYLHVEKGEYASIRSIHYAKTKAENELLAALLEWEAKGIPSLQE